jgi:hypothetical protein
MQGNHSRGEKLKSSLHHLTFHTAIYRESTVHLPSVVRFINFSAVNWQGLCISHLQIAVVYLGEARHTSLNAPMFSVQCSSLQFRSSIRNSCKTLRISMCHVQEVCLDGNSLSSKFCRVQVLHQSSGYKQLSVSQCALTRSLGSVPWHANLEF